jgi:hypothetical protein
MLLGDLLAEIEQASVAGIAVALLDDFVLVARVNEAVTAGTNPGSVCLRRMVEHVLKQDEQGPR